MVEQRPLGGEADADEGGEVKEVWGEEKIETDGAGDARAVRYFFEAEIVCETAGFVGTGKGKTSKWTASGL